LIAGSGRGSEIVIDVEERTCENNCDCCGGFNGTIWLSATQGHGHD